MYTAERRNLLSPIHKVQFCKVMLENNWHQPTKTSADHTFDQMAQEEARRAILYGYIYFDVLEHLEGTE